MNLKISEKMPKNKNKFRVVLANCGYYGETQTLSRLKKEFIKRDYELFMCNSIEHQFLVETVNPDLFLSIRPEFKPCKNCKNIFIKHHSLFDKSELFLNNMIQYDGFLFVTPNNELLKNKLSKIQKEFKSEQFFLSCPKTEFFETKIKKLFWCRGGQDEKRNKLTPVFKMLDKKQCVNFYGPPHIFENENIQNYKGEIPFDDSSALVNTMKQNGIALVIHSDAHFSSNTTTSRIFEAAAASCLIISDKLPFIEKNFKDSVLYIDIDNKTNEEIFSQIYKHIKWAFDNPEEATKKQKKSHEIFLKNFSLEDQVDKIERLYKKL